jgi:hypothetical protein
MHTVNRLTREPIFQRFRIAPPNQLRVNTRHSMRWPRLVQLALAGAVAVLLSSCEDTQQVQQQAQHTLGAIMPQPTPGGWFEGEGAHGEPKIVINLNEQKAYFYKGKRLVGESTVSSGKKGFSTPAGHYSVISKDKDHFSSEFGDYVDRGGKVVVSNIDVRKDRCPKGAHFDPAKMPYCMHFTGGYAMHQGYVPPYAASHGCIRIPQGMAEKFYNNAPVGTPVIVRGE